MPLIKMGTAARRAKAGSTNTIRRALNAAGIPLVTLSPGVWAVEEADLNRFLSSQPEKPARALAAESRPKPADQHGPAGTSASKPGSRKRRQ